MQLYSSNKTERLRYKGGCGVRERTHIKEFKRRAGFGLLLDYRQDKYWNMIGY